MTCWEAIVDSVPTTDDRKGERPDPRYGQPFADAVAYLVALGRARRAEKASREAGAADDRGDQ